MPTVITLPSGNSYDLSTEEDSGGGLHLLVEVKGNVAELLLEAADDFTLGSGGEGVATRGKDVIM